MDMSQYLEIFIEESKEHLQNLNQNLLLLEKSPNEMTTLNEIFRVAHTLKGIAGTMGFTKMATLTHDMENVLQIIRTGELSVTSSMVDILFKCLDALENYVNEVVNTGTEGSNQYDDIIQALNDISSKKGKAKVEEKKSSPAAPIQANAQKESLSSILVGDSLKDITKNGQAQESAQPAAGGNTVPALSINVKLNDGCLLKAARAYIVFQTLEKFCKVVTSNPSLEEIEDEKFEYAFDVTVITTESKDNLVKELNRISEVEKVTIDDVMVEKPVEEVEEKKEPEAKIEIKPTPQAPVVKVQETVQPARESTNENKASTAANVAKPKTGKTVRVDIDRLDTLMNLVSELIIIKTTLEGNVSSENMQNYNESIEYLERITTNLHDAVMKVRMVPVETVFNRFPRMIRDLARDLGKEIVLNMSGEETEVDRTVIDELGDPLIHLLRNSADHGIEEPDVRKQVGKPDFGTINLRAYHDGNNVVIEVEDDGKGINVDRVRKKIVEKGFIGHDIAQTLSDSEVIDYLFRPSVSTADKVTDVSGRGVGLDVVKTKIEALGGAIDIENEVGKRCKFIIRLPLTLAIIQALLVIVGEEKYAIPLSSIKEIINISPKEIKVVQNQEVYMLRNQVIPIVRLERILDVPKDKSQQNGVITIVNVKKGDKLCGFAVDSLIGQQEIVIKSLGKYLSGIRSIAGATILGDGQVALILDVNSLA